MGKNERLGNGVKKDYTMRDGLNIIGGKTMWGMRWRKKKRSDIKDWDKGPFWIIKVMLWRWKRSVNEKVMFCDGWKAGKCRDEKTVNKRMAEHRHEREKGERRVRRIL